MQGRNRNIIEALQQYITDEYFDKKQERANVSDWTVR